MFRKFVGLLLAALAVVNASAVAAVKPAPGLTGPATEAFGFDLFRELAKTGQFNVAGNANLAFSPFSIACVLAELRLGATGATEEALTEALHIDLASNDGASITRSGALDCPGITLAIANSLWIGTKFEPKKAFISAADEAFGNAVFSIDFGQPTGAAARMNGWIADHTQGHIKDLIVPRDLTATVMAIANAVYFKGQWQTRFDPKATSEQPFHRASGKDATVSMMHRSGKFGYAAMDGVALLSLPYGPGGASMILLLPEPGAQAMSGLQSILNKAWFERAVAALVKREAIVAVPKFGFSCEPNDLIAILKALGLASIFPPSRDFAKISDEPITVDLFKHRAWLEVNEQGTEAAAVTVAGMKRLAAPVKAPPVYFTADRPFLFVIRHNATGTPLFIGRVSDPATKK